MLNDYAVQLGSFHYGLQETPAPTLEQVQTAEVHLRELVAAGAVEAEHEERHYFGGGMYTRECTIKADSAVIGKQHRHEHPVFLMSGTCRINTDKGVETITGPRIWISPPNAKRALYTLTDCVFATVHLNPTDTHDLDAIEADVIVPEALLTRATPAMEGPFAQELQEVFA